MRSSRHTGGRKRRDLMQTCRDFLQLKSTKLVGSVSVTKQHESKDQ